MTTPDPFAPLTGQPVPDADGSTDAPDVGVIMPVPSDAPATNHRHSTLGLPVVVDPYFGSDGQTLCYHVRYITKQGKQDRMVCYTDKGWRFTFPPKPRPLFGLDLLAARPQAPVLVAEGEKAAKAARILAPDYVGVSWIGGQHGVRHTDWGPLAGRDVLIWRDHDEAGYRAQVAIIRACRRAGVRRVRFIEMDGLALHLGRAVPAKFDAADYDKGPEGFAKLLLDRTAIQEPEPEGEDSPGQAHQRLIEALEAYLQSEGLASNALEQWADAKTMRLRPRTTVTTIARTFGYHYRRGTHVGTDKIVETLSEMGRQMADERRSRIEASLAGQAATTEGQIELVKFVRALTGEDRPLYLHALKHWIWLIKRTIAGLPRLWEFMPVFVGKQGGGKSTAVARLTQPLKELACPIQASVLADPKEAFLLGQALVGIWDEMEGAGKQEVEALKNTITCEVKTTRVFHTQGHAGVLRTMCFIGTSNKPVGDVIRDPTGLRRFVQFDCSMPVDQEAINSIDYAKLWTCVSELDEAPAFMIRDELSACQTATRHRDSVSLWLASEEWGRLDWMPSQGETVTVMPYRSDRGESSTETRSRYIHWCKIHGEKIIQGSEFLGRLEDEGFRRNKNTVYRPESES